MCSSLRINNHLFGRNMDLDYELKQEIIITPRNYKIKLKKEPCINTHNAIIGIGMIINNFPLYYDAINEYGLGFCALNFPLNCKYYSCISKSINIAPFELGTYLLANYKSIKEIKKIIHNINICNVHFSSNIHNTPLHFMLSDLTQSLVIEPTKEGIKVYDNPFDILTNNPPFPYHIHNLLNYINLSNEDIKNNLNLSFDFIPYSYGMGAIGLPGDFSSSSRFIRGYFVKNFIDLNEDYILQAFKCFDSISMLKGCVKTQSGYEYTIYTSLYDLKKIIIYYKTYFNPIIKSIDIHNYDLSSSKLIKETI